MGEGSAVDMVLCGEVLESGIHVRESICCECV